MESFWPSSQPTSCSAHHVGPRNAAQIGIVRKQPVPDLSYMKLLEKQLQLQQKWFSRQRKQAHKHELVYSHQKCPQKPYETVKRDSDS